MTVTLADAQHRLVDLLLALPPGEPLVIEVNGEPFANVTRIRSNKPREPGSAKHLGHWMAPDFDAPLEDFREYVE